MNPYDDTLVGERLRLSREIIKEGATLLDMEAIFGYGDQMWNRWELGRTKLPIEVAYRIHERFGIERDWILYGEERYLNPVQREAIEAARERLIARQAGKQRTRARA